MVTGGAPRPFQAILCLRQIFVRLFSCSGWVGHHVKRRGLQRPRVRSFHEILHTTSCTHEATPLGLEIMQETFRESRRIISWINC